MRTIKLWRVRHHQNDRGDRFNIRYAATEKVAWEMAHLPWGFCGALGEVDQVELKVYETVQEVISES